MAPGSQALACRRWPLGPVQAAPLVRLSGHKQQTRSVLPATQRPQRPGRRGLQTLIPLLGVSAVSLPSGTFHVWLLVIQIPRVMQPLTRVLPDAPQFYFFLSPPPPVPMIGSVTTGLDFLAHCCVPRLRTGPSMFSKSALSFHPVDHGETTRGVGWSR